MRIRVLLCIAAGGLFSEYPEYKSLGKAPENLTIEEAMPSPETVPDTSRWVSLPGGLRQDCGQALQETSNGSVTGTRVLASDQSQQRWLYLRLNGDVSCQPTAGPLVGILKKADPSLPSWLKDKGLTVPASPYPLMEMSVDEDPGDLVVLLWGFVAIAILGLVTIFVFLRMKPALPARPAAEIAAVKRR